MCLLFSLLTLMACQSDTSGIGYDLGKCCASSEYKTFSTMTDNMPEFLKPLMVSNFQAAFSAMGMSPVNGQGSLKVTLRYEQDNMSVDTPLDDFEGHLEPGGKMRYLAKVWVEMLDVTTKKIVWSGSIQRIHDVDAGEYMHAGKASIFLREAFERLLRNYPGGQPTK